MMDLKQYVSRFALVLALISAMPVGLNAETALEPEVGAYVIECAVVADQEAAPLQHNTRVSEQTGRRFAQAILQTLRAMSLCSAVVHCMPALLEVFDSVPDSVKQKHCLATLIVSVGLCAFTDALID